MHIRVLSRAGANQIPLATMPGLSPLNVALTKIAARAEKRDAEVLRDTFVDSGVGQQLDSVDHQVLYGRRGTGKTHAATYLATETRKRGDVALNIDLRTVGSPDGVLDPHLRVHHGTSISASCRSPGTGARRPC